jgi:hypothetical protein
MYFVAAVHGMGLYIFKYLQFYKFFYVLLIFAEGSVGCGEDGTRQTWANVAASSRQQVPFCYFTKFQKLLPFLLVG